MKGHWRTIVTYIILGYAASFFSIYVFIVRRERKVKKELIVYILQQTFSIDNRREKKKETTKEVK